MYKINVHIEFFFLFYSVGEKRSRTTTMTENDQLGDTLTELSEATTLTFNDFVLPMEITSDNTSPNNTYTKETVHDPIATTAMSAIQNVHTIDNVPTELVDISENGSGSDDSGTFTVTPSSVTLSQSVHSTRLNSTLPAEEDITHTQNVSDSVEEEVVIKQNASVGLQIGSHGLDEQSIAVSVRTEIRDILKFQQQQLLSVLKTMEAKATHEKKINTDCGTQIDFREESFLPQNESPAAALYNRDSQSHTTQTLLEEQPLDNTMPVSINFGCWCMYVLWPSCLYMLHVCLNYMCPYMYHTCIRTVCTVLCVCIYTSVGVESRGLAFTV